MCAQNIRYYYYLITLLILLALCHSTESQNNGRSSRRRPTVSSIKANIEEVTEKSEAAADQIALAASHTEKNLQRRGGAYATEGQDYPYDNLEINLVRPERDPVHTQITAKYTASLGAGGPYDSGSLEDSETAEEYVANAMKMQRYGSRLREPIRILSTENAIQAGSKTPSKHVEDPGDNEREVPSSVNNKYEYYNPQQQKQQQTQQQQNQQTQPQLSSRLENNHKVILESQIHAQLQAQIQQAQQQAESQQQQQQQLGVAADNGQASGPNNEVAQVTASAYNRDPVTRSYQVYDDSINAYEANIGAAGGASDGVIDGDGVDRHYRTKYLFQPSYQGVSVAPAELEPEELRISASTEIPKAEIMKQIEKSVMKYMKELEAEAEEKHISSTTVRPKYPTVTPAHISLYGAGSESGGVPSPAAHRSTAQASVSGYSNAARHHVPKHQLKPAQRYQSETEAAYRAQANAAHQQKSHETSEVLAPNVEFVYKIKTRAPLQTATVKTISKPYTLPLKGVLDQFDHTAALKHLEDFDLSHVVTTQEPDERPSSLSASVTSKPNKLYFNSEIYHDINSLPFKSEKSRTLSASSAAAEYRKLKASTGEMSADYKGYSGYFAEPSPPQAEASDEKDPNAGANVQVSEDGYPVMNPYQYVLKKEPLPSRYEEPSSSWVETHAKPIYTALSASQKGLEYDSYSPKFNNNPEGYGYQHSHKVEREREREREREPREPNKYAISRLPSGGSSKRGKRGGGLPYPNLNKKSQRNTAVKDIEANLALRPPPKN
ncbi:uncharacterized protein LOC101449755 isoform X2 [Ceratitis capitata]|nr:uncharacterized protein LOC101449755 isoform X2 [Ceratitis capitata]